MKRIIFLVMCMVATAVFAQEPTITILSPSAVNVRYDGKTSNSAQTKWKTKHMKVEYVSASGKIIVKDKRGNTRRFYRLRKKRRIYLRGV